MLNTKSTGYSIFMSFYILWGLWYIFLDSSIILRPYYQILWPTMVVVGLFFSIRYIFHGCREINKNTKLFCLFMFVCMLSTLSSMDDKASFLYIQKMILAYGFALVITLKDYDKIINNGIIGYCTFLLVVSIIQLFFSPVYNWGFLPLLNQDVETLHNGLRQGLAVGFTNGTSQNGLFMSIGFLFCATYAIYKKKYKFVFFVLAIIFFLMTFATGKRNYSIIIILNLLALLFFKFRGESLIKFIMKIGIIGLFFVLIFVIIADYLPVLNSVMDKFNELSEKDDVTNGRLDLYHTTWLTYELNNYQALGVNALKSVSGIETHNSYLQWVVEFGLVMCWIPIFYMIRITIIYSRKIVNFTNTISDEEVIKIVLPFLFINQVLISAFVALPFQWHNVMGLFFIFQIMLIRNLSFLKKENQFFMRPKKMMS